jgi:transposase
MEKDANRLADQQVKAYFSRLSHIDELFRQAEQKMEGRRQPPEVTTHLDRLRQERDRLAERLDRTSAALHGSQTLSEIEFLGPLAIWDIVAEELEKLVERFTK